LQKKPAGVSQGERNKLLPSEPDNGETYGYDGRAIVDHRSIVGACEQSCPMCEPEKPNNNKQRANHPDDDLHDTLAAQFNDGDIDRKRVAMEKPAGQPGGLVSADLSRRLADTLTFRK
jgi:hypothetical protein